MSHDVVSDALNQIMNARRIEKKSLIVGKYSKVLIKLLEIMKDKGHIDFKINLDEKTLQIEIIKMNECKSVKPRYFVGASDIDRYLRRFLPSRRFGTLVISTNQGLLTHKEAIEKKIGGSLIAYFY